LTELAPGSGLSVRLAANTLVQLAGSMVASVISFATFVAATRGLGPEAFGEFTAATAYLVIPTVVADIGLSTGVLREISARPERTEPAMRRAVPLMALIGIAAVVAAVFAGLLLPFTHQTKVAILIASTGAFFTVMTFALQPVLQAQLKMHWAVAATVTGRVTTFGLTLAALSTGFEFEGVVAAHSIGIGVTAALHLMAVALIVPLRPVFDVAYWRRLMAGSFALGLAIAISLIYFRVDATLLALIRPPEEVGLYGAAYKFIELAGLVVAATAASVFPPLTRFVASGDARRAGGLVQKAFDALLAAGAPLAILMVAFSEEIVVWTSGPEFREGGVALAILAPYVLVFFANGILWRVLISTDRDRELLATAVAVLVLNVVLNLIFLPEYGFKAAAVIAVVSEFAVAVPIVLLVRADGLLPNLRYLGALAAASLAMIAAIVFLPGPALVRAAVSTAVYVVVVLVLPGTAREVVVGELVPATLRALRGRP
jgi:O-antigen/teichoic acid export membrane protein